MENSTRRDGRRAVAALLFLLGSALFAAAYCQAPLYYSNQNQYFLHGLAWAGVGSLDEDWLAKTADPTPVFSTLVAVTARYLPAWTFHVYYALLLGAYAAAMLGVFVYLAGPELARRRWPVFCLLFLTAHSALPRWLSYQIVNFDYPWFLQAGVAGQYLLGAMLQPSSFGVLLVVAVAAFAWGRPYLAAVLTGAAGVLHSTYLLPGALLTLGFLAALLAERRWRTAVASGALALAIVSPVVAYALLRFGPTTPKTFAEAQDILVNVRIPHHSRVDLWLDWVAGLQIAWVAVALLLAWRTRLFLVLAVPFALSAALTAWQAATGSQALALLFPWRVSAVLVPIATTVILARLAALPLPSLDGTAARATAFAGCAALAFAGVWIMANRLGFHSDPGEVPVMEYVLAARSPGEVYLLPVRVPDLEKATRGSLSSDFKPLATKKRDGRVIPVDLQRFRLSTGAAIFVDFKSIPYKDTEVIEWRDRLRLAQALNDDLAAGRVPLAELRRLGITHVVRPAADVNLPGLEKVHEDVAYQVYRVPTAFKGRRWATGRRCGRTSGSPRAFGTRTPYTEEDGSEEPLRKAGRQEGRKAGREDELVWLLSGLPAFLSALLLV